MFMGKILMGKIHREGWITGAPSQVTRALHLAFWSLAAHSSSSAGSNHMMLMCWCPSGPKFCSSLPLPSSSRCPQLQMPLHLDIFVSPSNFSPEMQMPRFLQCPQAPTLTQPQALLPPLSHICLLNSRGLPVKVLQALHIFPPSLTHYQPNQLMMSKTSTKISKIWITLTLRSMASTTYTAPKGSSYSYFISNMYHKIFNQSSAITFKSAREIITLRQ